MFNEIENKIDFSEAPIFFKCPLCKHVGFIYIGEIGGYDSKNLGGTWHHGRKLYRCDNCHMVISE